MFIRIQNEQSGNLTFTSKNAIPFNRKRGITVWEIQIQGS